MSRLAEWCARRDSNPHIFRQQDLNLPRLPIPPRARGRLKWAAYSKDAPWGKPLKHQKQASAQRVGLEEEQFMQDTPKPELPPVPGNPPSTPDPTPSQPGQP